MDWKKIGRIILFPPLFVVFLLLPVAVGFFLWAILTTGSQSALTIASYVLAAYTLTVWCAASPKLYRMGKAFFTNNRHIQRWRSDAQWRMKLSLWGSLLWNAAYGVFQLCLGIFHSSFWFSSMAGYYFCLAAMRLYLARYAACHTPGEKMKAELIRYRTCGWIFLLMNLALSLMVFFMVYWNRTFHHHQITTIALAAYTFTALALAIRNVVKYRKYNSPVYSASKAISLAAGCVSILTLEATMLTAFGGQTMTLTARRIFLGATGAAVSAFVVILAVAMIRTSNQKLRLLKNTQKENENGR